MRNEYEIISDFCSKMHEITSKEREKAERRLIEAQGGIRDSTALKDLTQELMEVLQNERSKH